MSLSTFGNVLNVLGRQDVYLVGSGIGAIIFFVAWHGLSSTSGASLIVAAAQSMLLATFATTASAAFFCYFVCRRHDRAAPSTLREPA